MGEVRTIEICSRHIGRVSFKCKGESRKVTFEELQPNSGVGVGKVSPEEAEVLLGHPNLKNDFWKEGPIEVQVEKPAVSKPVEGSTSNTPPKAAEQIEKIKAAATEDEVNTILGEDKRPSVISAAQIRIEEIKEAATGNKD